MSRAMRAGGRRAMASGVGATASSRGAATSVTSSLVRSEMMVATRTRKGSRVREILVTANASAPRPTKRAIRERAEDIRRGLRVPAPSLRAVRLTSPAYPFPAQNPLGGSAVKTVFAVLVAASSAALSAQPVREPGAYAPAGTPLQLGLAGYAKVLCSAVFVSGRDPAEAFFNSGSFFLPEDARDGVTYKLDREEKLARVTRGSITREARFHGDQGCIIESQERPGIFFEPGPVRTTLPAAMSQPWPMGDLPSKDPLPPGIDKAGLDRAVQAAFANPEGLTAALVVVYKGRLVAERYGPGIDKDTQLESWSMGKSITATLLGLLVKDGTYRVEDPAPVPEWQKDQDPRGRIRILDLLRMSSG